MDWHTVWIALIASIGGTGAMLAIAAFLGKKWVGIRIEESVKHEYAVSLEEHKARLQEQLSEFVADKEAARQRTAEHKEADRKLFLKFLNILPSDGSIEFLRVNNMAGFSFELRQLNHAKDFFFKWRGAEFRFLDPELEDKRAHLYKLIGEYLSCIGKNTFPSNIAGWNSVPPEWEAEQPERFDKVVDDLHSLAGAIVEAHQDLLLMGRQKLGC